MYRTSAFPLSNASPMTCAIAGMLALAVAMGIGRFAFTPVLPMMLDDAGLSIRQGSWLASVNYAGYFIGAVGAGLLRISAGTAIRGGLGMIGLVTLAMALPLPIEGWMAMRFLAGTASAWVLIAISSWSLETLGRHQRPGLSSVVFAGVGAGIATAGLLCIALLQAAAASTHAWLLLGALSVAVTLLVWPVFPPSNKAAPRSRPKVSSGERWSADAVCLVVCYGVFGFGYIIPATFLPVMAKNTLQDPALFGWSWPLFGAAAAVSTLLVAPAKRFFSSAQVLAASYFVMAFGVALPVLRSDMATISIAALCVGGTFMVMTLTAMQEARRIAGERAPALIAAMTATFAAGQIAGPLAVGTSTTDGAFTLALLTASLLLLLSGVAMAIRAGLTRKR